MTWRSTWDWADRIMLAVVAAVVVWVVAARWDRWQPPQLVETVAVCVAEAYALFWVVRSARQVRLRRKAARTPNPQWYAIHDHGYGGHTHATTYDTAVDHAGVEAMSWEQARQTWGPPPPNGSTTADGAPS